LERDGVGIGDTIAVAMTKNVPYQLDVQLLCKMEISMKSELGEGETVIASHPQQATIRPGGVGLFLPLTLGLIGSHPPPCVLVSLDHGIDECALSLNRLRGVAADVVKLLRT